MTLVASAASVEKASTPLNQTMKTLDGQDVNLADKYQGKVVLLVNVASKCGNTPQYKPLEGLHEKYAEKGLAIVGVPCNQFGGQEPGTAADITEFCTKNYGVKFDMLSKVDVNGDDACPLYKSLTSKESDPEVCRKDQLELREVPLRSQRPARGPLRAEDTARFARSRDGNRDGAREVNLVVVSCPVVELLLEASDQVGKRHLANALSRFGGEGVVVDGVAHDRRSPRGTGEQLAGDPGIGEQAEHILFRSSHFLEAVFVKPGATDLLADFAEQITPVRTLERFGHED